MRRVMPMSSFTCQHLDLAADWCLLLKTDCVPGRKGCVLQGSSQFLFPAEERVEELAEKKKDSSLFAAARQRKRSPRP
jgi:hypothetical protein